MNPDHLIDLAEQIIGIGVGYPRQATVNRAVSTAYYALFHALCGNCVVRTVGSPKGPLYRKIATPIFRSIDHGSARKVFDRIARDGSALRASRELAESFIALQTARIAADYEPGSRCTRRDALDYIAQARAAIDTLRSLPKDERMLLAVQLITKPR